MDIAIIPRAILDQLETDPERRIHLNVLLSHLLLFSVAALAVRLPSALVIVPHVCLFQTLCGIPCPGCGITSSAVAFLGGDVGRAWTLNPVGPVLLVVVAIQVPLRAVALRRVRWSGCVLTTSRGMTISVLVALIANWLRQIT
ncbi:MAG: DUF2752 domain-containing protein [Candidatus Eiseniibacteriota bacterium]